MDRSKNKKTLKYNGNPKELYKRAKEIILANSDVITFKRLYPKLKLAKTTFYKLMNQEPELLDELRDLVYENKRNKVESAFDNLFDLKDNVTAQIAWLKVHCDDDEFERLNNRAVINQTVIKVKDPFEDE